jgi:hypothetical protein
VKSTIQYHGLLLLVLVALGLATGCSSLSNGGPTSLRQTRDNVDWPMNRYRNRLAFGFITYGEEQQVTSAYKSYQTAFNEALDQASGNYSAPTPSNVTQLANQLLTTLAAIP